MADDIENIHDEDAGYESNGDEDTGYESDDRESAGNEDTGYESADNKSVGGYSEEIYPGALYVIGTPIGNLGDLSLRARFILGAVDVIAAEDTRHTRRLLNAFGIRQKLVSYHEHNEMTRSAELIAALKSGQTVGLVSDAGLPAISDPGAVLVAACHEHDIKVVVVPGPVALTVAFAASGIRADSFVFCGFIPHTGAKRRRFIEGLVGESRPQIIYEAPHRLVKTLRDLETVGLADREILLARELTKRFEEYWRGSVAAALDFFATVEPRGEYVLVLYPLSDADDESVNAERLSDAHLLEVYAESGSLRSAAVELSRAGYGSRNEIYKRLLELTKEN